MEESLFIVLTVFWHGAKFASEITMVVGVTEVITAICPYPSRVSTMTPTAGLFVFGSMSQALPQDSADLPTYHFAYATHEQRTLDGVLLGGV